MGPLDLGPAGDGLVDAAQVAGRRQQQGRTDCGIEGQEARLAEPGKLQRQRQILSEADRVRFTGQCQCEGARRKRHSAAATLASISAGAVGMRQ